MPTMSLFVPGPSEEKAKAKKKRRRNPGVGIQLGLVGAFKTWLLHPKMEGTNPTYSQLARSCLDMFGIQSSDHLFC